jgi:DNA-binding transcriptional LysR family regulator
MDRLTAMTSFVRVVENSGFSAAARRLGISTSLVTTHVKALEDRLGVRLLNRSTRKISPTEVGQTYFERCVQILSELEEADGIAEASQLKPRGVLRLNVAQAVPPVIAPSLAEFNALYPEASVRVTITSRMVDLIEEGFDLAIRLTPVRDSSLIIRRLAAYHMVICGSSSYFERHGRPEHPADLVHHNCLIFYDSLWGVEWHFAGPQGNRTIRVSGSLETNSVVTLRMAALLGEGLICVPSFMVSTDLASGDLIAVLTEFMHFEFSVDAIYPHRRYLPAKVRSFVDLVVKQFHDTKCTHANGISITQTPALPLHADPAAVDTR